jgi:protein phosphatase 1K
VGVAPARPAPHRRAAARSVPATPLRSVAASAAPARIADAAFASNKGTSRKVNEDRHALNVAPPPPQSSADPFAYAAVYDGHGGAAVADWLVKNLERRVRTAWSRHPTPEEAVTQAFAAADAKILAPKAGFFGVGERGVGGSKCGSTAAVAIVFNDPAAGGAPTLLAANVGDARVLLRRASGAVSQLTTDHVPDDEDERIRIEKTNPNPKLPLVRFVGGTWRVGGLLALSRAFGDAHLKGSLQFEGLTQGVRREGMREGEGGAQRVCFLFDRPPTPPPPPFSLPGDSYGSGFGVTAIPTVTLTPLLPGDTVIVCSDGLNANVERGGGGGLDNDVAGAIVAACGDAAEGAAALVDAAAEAGSTDDVTVVVLKVGG